MVLVMAGSTTGGRRWRPARHGVFVRSVAALTLLGLTGCTSSPGHPPKTEAAVLAAGQSPVPSTPKEPALHVAGDDAGVSYATPVRITVTDGSFVSVHVGAKTGGEELGGSVSGDATSWVSKARPKPSLSYSVSATVTDTAGKTQTRSTTFTVANVPASQRISFTVTPDDSATVGIGQPIVVRFAFSVARRAALEKVMHVKAQTRSGASVTGSWRWLNSREVHWRPRTFWTPGTKVRLDMRIAGVQAAAHRYGRKDYSETFTIGAAHVTKVDASAHRTRVYRNGKLVDTWPSGTGRKGLETYSGTYIVLSKASVVTMDSCSARVTCDKNDPDYYNEKEYWATRITRSGTFLHAASWDHLLGRANVSHGCIHLSDSDAKDFFHHAVPGDVVIVSHSGRGPQERINTQDPGLYDWNLSWSTWKKGSALK